MGNVGLVIALEGGTTRVQLLGLGHREKSSELSNLVSDFQTTFSQIEFSTVGHIEETQDESFIRWTFYSVKDHEESALQFLWNKSSKSAFLLQANTIYQNGERKSSAFKTEFRRLSERIHGL